MLNTLTLEEKEKEQRKVIERLIEHYHLLYEMISSPEGILPKVDLDMAIHSLSPSEQKVITLTCIQGYTYREVEELTGIPKSTIGDLKKKAIDKLVEKCLVK
jgi:DNA-directed RNA polymerase specialized sigma24 family protein